MYVVWFFLPARFLYYRYRWVHGVAINLALVLAGWLQASEKLRSAEVAGKATGGRVVVELLEAPLERARSYRFTARVLALSDSAGWRAGRGPVMVYLEKSAGVDSLEYGARLLLHATMRPVSGPANPGEFDYRGHLRMRGIGRQVYARDGEWQPLAGSGGRPFIRWSLDTRSLFMGILRDACAGDREFALAAAIILGYDEHLDPEQRDQFAGAGAMHVLCVSGLHVGILALVLTRLLFFMNGRRGLRILRLILVAGAIWAYAAITGFSPSVLRAATMFSFMYAGRSFRRPVSSYNMLAASAFILLSSDPLMIARVGFQLSYLAVTGILLLYEPVNALFTPRYLITGRVWQLSAVSLAATLATYPLSIHYFHRFPNLFLLTNLVAIPVSFLVLYNGLALLAFSFSPHISAVLSFIFGKVLTFLDRSIAAIDSLPYSSADALYVTGAELFLLFVLTGLLAALLVDPRKIFLFALLIACNVLVSLFAVRAVKESRQRILLVYNIRGHTALEFVHGRESVLVGDSALLASPGKVDYATQGARLGLGVRNTVFIRLDTAGMRRAWMAKRGDLLEFAGTRVAVMDLGKEPLSSGGPLRVDLLVVRGHTWKEVPGLPAALRPGIAILDGSLNPRVAEEVTRRLNADHIPCLDVRDGAFFRKLPRLYPE